MKKKAMYYEKKEDKKVQCHLCPHNCIIANNKVGICRVRKNIDEDLYTLIYGEVSSIAMDPIEKKPLYHFYPGKTILSIGTVGCSFRCKFCQNYNISQNPEYPTDYYSKEDIVNLAKKRNSIGIAYTYSEPLIWYEYILDVCKLAKANGLKNVFVTNGYINPEPLENLLPYVDAVNVDLKSFQEDFYKNIVIGDLDPVLRTIEEISRHKNISLEVTTLVIPGYNDSSKEMENITDFISSLDRDIPFHLSKYYPMYKFNALPTPISTLERLKKIALKKLGYVYLGNVGGYTNTYCKNCGALLIERIGYSVKVVNVIDSKCNRCQGKFPVMF